MTEPAASPHDVARRRLLQALAAGLVAPWATPHAAPRNAMLYRPIPVSGEQLPVIGLSASRLFDVGPDPLVRAGPLGALTAMRKLNNAVIETSPLDGRAESVVGELLDPAARARVFLASKVWTAGQQAGIRGMEASLRALRTDHFDLLQVHNLVDWRLHLGTLRAWRDLGRTRYIGVTHYHRAALPMLVDIVARQPLDFVQINYSIFEPEAEAQLLPLAQNRKVAVIVSHPFADGRLFRQVRGRPLPAWASDYGIDSWPALFLKFVVSHPAVTCVLSAAANERQMRAHLAAGLGLLPSARDRHRIADYVRSL